jgi:hypothetical protein
MKSIERIAQGKFKVTTPDVENGELLLDFNPIILKFNLSGRFKLIHWQAKPKGHREFGIYNFESDSYRSLVSLESIGYGGIQLLQLDDATANTIPSAVICHRGSLR